MKLLSALRKKKVERDFYFSLILKPHKAAAILFEKTPGSLVIISTKEAVLEKDLDALSGDELVQVIDTVTSSVEGALPENEQAEKTIFSVPYSWQTDGKISKDNLMKLKKICDALELKAIGFIISVEAVVNFMQKKDGVPVKAIFVEHAANQAIVYIVEKSNIVEVQSSEVGEDFVTTVEKLLTQVEKVDSFPAKIILHDYEGVESLQQEFLNHEWKKELNFLHVPQVMVLEKGYENEAVINGVATQMGFDVLHDVKAGAVVDEDGNVGVDDPEEVEIASADEFGFSSTESTAATTLEELTDNSTEEEDNLEAESVDVSESEEEKNDNDLHDNLKEPKINTPLDIKENELSVEDPDEKKHEAKHHLPDTRVTLVEKLREMLPITFLLTLLRGGGRSMLKRGANLRVGIIALAAILLISFITYGYYNWYLKTEVVIFADSQVVTTDEGVVLSEDQETSYSEKTINLSTVSESIDISTQRQVTGKKETGDKATGEITLYNKTDRPVTFEKGTVISSGNDLEFVTLAEVKIASTSSFATDFSKQKVKVEASSFGKEYNLPSNTNFTIEGQSTSNAIAKNEGAFSGGSTKELTVISAKDLEALREEAEKGSLDKALSAVRGKIGSEALLINTPISVELEDEKISGKEGQEAKTVSLKGKLVYTFGTYTKEDISDFVMQMSEDEIPEGYTYIDDQSDVQLNDIKVDKASVSAQLSVNAVFAPNIEVSKLLGSLTGKRLKSSEETIKALSGVSDVTIVRKNSVPFFPAFLPFNSKNIQIVLKTDG